MPCCKVSELFRFFVFCFWSGGCQPFLHFRRAFHLFVITCVVLAPPRPEVTKAAMKVISGEVTVAHTTDDIDAFSVTSFYEVGLDLGLMDRANDMVYYSSNGDDDVA